MEKNIVFTMACLVFSSQPTVKEGKNSPFVARKLEICNDVELNPGPRSPVKKNSKVNNVNGNNQANMSNGDPRESMPANDLPRVKRLGK